MGPKRRAPEWCEHLHAQIFFHSNNHPHVTISPHEQAAARCKLSIEALETSSESSADRSTTSNATDGGVAAREKDEIYQRLVERYSDLTDTMMDWGVEVSQRSRERTRPKVTVAQFCTAPPRRVESTFCRRANVHSRTRLGSCIAAVHTMLVREPPSVLELENAASHSSILAPVCPALTTRVTYSRRKQQKNVGGSSPVGGGHQDRG